MDDEELKRLDGNDEDEDMEDNLIDENNIQLEDIDDIDDIEDMSDED